MSGVTLNDYTKGSGLLSEQIQGGETIPAYSLVYVDASGQWMQADAVDASTICILGLSTESLRVNQKGRVVIQGFAVNNTWSWTPGGLIYASAIAGGLTQIEPESNIQEVAKAISSTLIYFNPSGLGGLTTLNKIENQLFSRSYALDTTNQTVSSAAEQDLTAPGAVTVTFPANATFVDANLTAILKANNQSANAHNIGVTLQENIAGAGWSDLRSFTASPPLSLPDTASTGDAVIFAEQVSTIATGETATFRFQVDSDDANEVHYTQTFVLNITYNLV